MHHDIEPMPNSNVLCIAWEVKSSSDATAAGRSQASTIWPDSIIEVQPQGTSGGTIVWEWHAWDHLVQDYNSSRANYGVVADHLELIDVNLGGGSGAWGSDWMHMNGVSYNPQTDQIVFSSHYLNELYVIDHSTTTQQAAGHTGGRYGKGGFSQNYDRGASGSQVFYAVHNACWIPSGLPGAGNIVAFNNGSYSTIEEIIPPLDSSGNFILDPGSAYGRIRLPGVIRLPDFSATVSQAPSTCPMVIHSSVRLVVRFLRSPVRVP